MKTTLTPEMLDPIMGALSRANAGHDTLFPGDFFECQPVHTVYGSWCGRQRRLRYERPRPAHHA